MIDEKKLTKDLYKWFSGKRAYCINHGFYDLLNDFEDCFDEFTEIIDEQQKLSLETKTSDKWIPCSERLPEVNQIVMCSIKKEYANHRIVLQRFANEEYWHNGIVEAWMPLPEPYKGE